MKKRDLFKVVSFAGMALGAIGTLLSNWAEAKELDRMIDEKVSEQLAAHEEKESEEP